MQHRRAMRFSHHESSSDASSGRGASESLRRDSSITSTRDSSHEGLQGSSTSVLSGSVSRGSGSVETVPSPGFWAEKATLLLLLQTPAQWGVQWPSSEVEQQWQGMMDVSAFSILDAEVC